MLAKGMCVGLLVASQLLGQTSGGLPARIQAAPLTPAERQALTAAWSKKEFERMEAVLIGAARTATPIEHASTLCALLGALEFSNKRMNQAVQGFRQADSLSPLDDEDRFTLAMALIDLGDVKAARAELTRLFESHPRQSIYLYWLARLDYGQRLYEDAIEKFKQVVSLDPASVRGYDNLGLSYDMMGRNEQAQTAFAKAVELNRKLTRPSPWPAHDLGYLQLRLQQFAAAEENLREALKYDPKFALAHYHLARVLENEGRNDAAIEEHKAAAALDVKLAEPLYSLGLLYRRGGQMEAAANAMAEYKRRKAFTPDAP
ncbi:MAG: tetratricopeptide repeat protein [Bryobacteraceae bacterium]|nr:tetratricopeptide repeat protein [Bryobacteraceae bacterium]